MARIFKPQWTKTLSDGTKIRRKTRKWYITYREPDGTEHTVPGFVDKTATNQLAAQLEREAAQRAVGMCDRFGGHRMRGLSEHVADWHTALVAKGGTDTHAELSANRVRRVFGGCDFKTWSDLSGSKVQAFIADLNVVPRRKFNAELTSAGADQKSDRPRAGSIETRNYYLQAVKAFAQWMVRDNRAPDNPLAHLTFGNTRIDRRHDRRALSADELTALVQAAYSGPVRYGVSGPDRAILYRVGVETGLRASELRSLTVASFALNAAPPTVTVAAGYSKRRREDVQPMRPKLAAELRTYFANRLPAARAFTMPSRSNVVRMLRGDLVAARTAWINEATDPTDRARREASSFLKYRDDVGRVADFHSLRHTFISNLARGGVHPKVAQTLARHSTITLTMDRYTHSAMGDLQDALDTLPDLRTDLTQETHQRATGACGAASQGNANTSPPARPNRISENPLTAPLTAHSFGEGRQLSGAVGATARDRCNFEAPNVIQLAGLDDDRRDKSSTVEMGRAGVEPATHGFSVRCSTN